MGDPAINPYETPSDPTQSQIQQPPTEAVEPTLTILDKLVFTVSFLGGAMLGRLVLGHWISGSAVGWLGMSSGGSLGLIVGSYVYSRFHPQHWLRGVESQIVEMLIIIGSVEYVMTQWLGEFGALVGLFIIPVVMNLILFVRRRTTGSKLESTNSM